MFVGRVRFRQILYCALISISQSHVRSCRGDGFHSKGNTAEGKCQVPKEEKPEVCGSTSTMPTVLGSTF